MTAIDFNCREIRYAIVGRHLEIFRDPVRLARFDLCPGADRPVRIGAFRREGARAWAPLEGAVEGRAVVEMKDGRIGYTVETSQKHFDRLTYFPSSTLDGDLLHTFIWTQRDRAWEMSEDVEVKVRETGGDAGHPCEGYLADPSDMPPYWPGRCCPRVCAAHHPETGWWGMCLPGPLPVCETAFRLQQERFDIAFRYLRPGCEDGFMPTVWFALPLSDPRDPYSVMPHMWELSAPWRLEPDRDYPRSKFQGLAVCHPWDPIQQAIGKTFTEPIPLGAKESPMTPEFLLGLLNEFVAFEPSVKWHFWLPQGWYKNVGDYEIGDNLGGEEGFRNLADEFRKGGHLLTVHVRLSTFNERSKVGREHPDWAAPQRPENPIRYWANNPEEEGAQRVMDVTRPEVREHLKGQIRRFLSDEPGCLNMDGVSPTADRNLSALDFELADDDYGVGDLLAYKVNKELLLYAKSVKPRAHMYFMYMPSLYGISEEAHTMEDYQQYPMHTIQQLRLITNLYPTLPLHTANWCVSRTKALALWPLGVAAGRPEIDNPHAFPSPFLTGWHDMDQAYRRRTAATLTAYANSPWTPDTVNIPAKVEGEGLRMEVTAGRRRTEGPLAGFYGALSLGSQTVVTFSETLAMVAGTLSKTVTVPLPPGAVVESVNRVGHDGEREAHEYAVLPEGLRLHAPDAAGETKLVEINYRLPKR
jgi:hypothetical protein